MLKDVSRASAMDADTLKALRDEQALRLMVLQQQIRAAKIPVIVLFEGWDASGKGSAIGELIRSLDPRGFKVHTLDLDDPAEERYPFLHRYWKVAPLYGNMAILDGSWYRGVSHPECRTDEETTRQRLAQILDFESQLIADGTVLIKFFLHITKKEQKKRFQELESHKSTAWRVTELDWKHHENYAETEKAYDRMIEATNTKEAPWTVIHATDRRQVASQMYSIVISALEAALRQKEITNERWAAEKAAVADGTFTHPSPLTEDRETISGGFARELIGMPRLADVNLDHSLTREEYEERLKNAQKKLAKLHNALYLKKAPVIIGFEGWDAAGKGGAIKRLTRALDPRGFEAIPTAAPSFAELNHHYLWRFWNAVPKNGHFAIFDRTWYGRVMVERLEHLTPSWRCDQAYAEINQFERSLFESGAVVLKFWLHISPDEQLARFTDRQNTPEKRWKITDEDWRNREKWPLYEQAVDEMLALTSTRQAPWVIMESCDKLYARIKVLETVIDTVEKALK